jgi:hypothetical protein
MALLAGRAPLLPSTDLWCPPAALCGGDAGRLGPPPYHLPGVGAMQPLADAVVKIKKSGEISSMDQRRTWCCSLDWADVRHAQNECAARFGALDFQASSELMRKVLHQLLS